ncbi:hypothetical protein IQ230_15675 [Gloeocapsopsis crepidinum LEGE 06123]|uniref:Uncharacterized protein n=1 Tax=Gloeocapsopsis crepidinum LEGE 06123 TaxID=588587 RepID=A0ABR9UU17_9CHRO|nr:hypothetical protein [Gloeocapsopsis crepidinum]MBE9191762.1 hypothetical protein [Gloeocapsopsis crepidinum LEGE 06123]
MFNELKVAYLLSLIIAVLTFVAAVGGLVLPDLYRDNLFVTSGWFGNDLVTLVVAFPILIIALILSARGSQRAQLVWLGMLNYTLYNFAFYLFGAAYNRFFLIYAALFTLSIFALIFGLVGLDVKEISQKFGAKTPVKLISAYMLFVAIALGGFWISQAVNFISTGQVPQIIVTVNGSTNVIAALDLSMVVSIFLLSAIWLWQRQPWGYVLGTIANIKGAVYTLALTAATISAASSGVADTTLVPLWGFLSLGSLIASLFLLRFRSNSY